jgi:transposase
MAAEAEARARTLLIEKLKLTIKKLRHEQFGQSSERGALLDQLELQLADLEENAAHAETAAQPAAAETITVPAFERRKSVRRPLRRICRASASSIRRLRPCPCCGDSRLRKIGEDMTETLELIPRQWKVIQHVREKFSHRACEAITQPPVPSHPIARSRSAILRTTNLREFRSVTLVRASSKGLERASSFQDDASGSMQVESSPGGGAVCGCGGTNGDRLCAV